MLDEVGVPIYAFHIMESRCERMSDPPNRYKNCATADRSGNDGSAGEIHLIISSFV